MQRWLARLSIILVILFATTTTGFVGWAYAGGDPEPVALPALESDENVTVTNGELLVFMPAEPKPVGYIFYPGGRVEPEAFARTLRPIAEAGYPVVVVPMPLNLAVLSPGRGELALAAYPTIEHWVIGGHSLGGAMAANFVYNHPEEIDGLVMLASYPPESNPLTGWGGPIITLYGSRDGVATVEEVEAARGRLPADATYRLIEGGNHAQFGDYGPQRGDTEATITAEQQQAAVIAATLDVLEQVNASSGETDN